MEQLPLAPAHASGQRIVAIVDAARAVERARILVDAACEALLAVEHLVPEARALAEDAEELLPRLRDVLDRIDQPELPLAAAA